ncbi:tumor suppressor, Mitostatin, putative [Leishmania donovani]|uniref:Cilia- and flagella-associated protein 53 n=1 Tax=Leishmania donovani TaxID=5661 RepID=A0A3Q8IMD7_LEIDO|nr:tumor suppressor, Mitostatin, putative [Leishmania donovani]
MPRGHVGLSSIEARQRRESFMEKFNAEQTAQERQKRTVEWELRGNERHEQKDLLQYMDVIQAQHNDVLVARRRRLAELLTRENELHTSMMTSLPETDAQRRERLIRKAQELRAKREEAKRLDNCARHDRLFCAKIDCLRQAESRLKVMQVADARYEQMDAAAERRRQEAAEDVLYAQQATEAQRLATEREQRNLEMQYNRKKRMVADLAAQVEGNRQRKEMEKENARRDTEEFYRLLHEEQAEEARKRLQWREKNRQLAQEMMEMNEELKRARQQEYEQLKKEDKEALDAILASLAAEQQEQRAEKQRRMAAERQHMLDLQKMAQCKDDKHALDKLWAEENEKQWRKREVQWEADQAKRDTLLRNILIARRQQILDKRQKAKEDAMLRKLEDEKFLESLSKERDIDAVERERRMALLKETQQYLEWQIQQRIAEKEAARLAKRTELTDEQALEKQYEDRIAREMANLEAAKPSRYRDVPLLPKKHRNQLF